MLEQAAGLSPRALDAIAELEQRVVEADGGRLKLEWAALRRRGGGRVRDLLWWDGERLLGFLGFYSFGPWLELAGMVAPGARRRGIATALLDAAGPLYRTGAYRRVLLIVPRASSAGRALAERRGGVLDHSEHALVLTGAPTAGCHERAVKLRPASSADVETVARLLEAGFGHPAPDVAGRLDAPGEHTLVIELEGVAAGTMRITRDGSAAGIYGFVVHPSLRGQGIGRAALRRACERLRSDGAQQIELEVEIENDRALGLYSSIGFAPVTTEDYYALPL